MHAMPSAASPSISVIVPVHNGGGEFRDCLDSLTRVVPAPREIIIVADGESDGSWKLAESLGLQILRLPVTGGPARARNYGARAASDAPPPPRL